MLKSHEKAYSSNGKRMVLIAEMDLQNIAGNNKGEGTVAIGISEYRPEEDSFVSDVFGRADRIMYENKEHLKNW